MLGNVNNNAVTLDLPPLLDALHSTFNISRLKPYRHSDHALFPGRPQRLHQPPAVDADTNGDARYEVESVMAQRGSTNRRELLIRWKGYGAEHDEWQPRSHLIRTAPIAVAEFDARQQGGSRETVQAVLNQLIASRAYSQRPTAATSLWRTKAKLRGENVTGARGPSRLELVHRQAKLSILCSCILYAI